MYELGCYVLESSNMKDTFLSNTLLPCLVAWDSWLFFFFFPFKILCISNFGCTGLGGLLWVYLGISHVIAVIGSSPGAGWLKIAPCTCLAVGVGYWARLRVSSTLAQAFSWGGSIPRKQSQCASDFQVSNFIPFTNVLWTKAKPRVNVGEMMPRHGWRRYHLLGAITVTVNYRLWPK